jgi:hypothetical protein
MANTANTFVWHNDPNSTVIPPTPPGFIGTPGVPGSDSLTYTPFYASNTSGHALSDVGLFIPFAWARVDNPGGSLNHYERLTWDNSRNGFLDSDFNHTREAVLLTPNIVTHPDTPDGHVVAGSVADLTDTHRFAPNSASVQTGIPASVFPPETILPGDLLPFADLGGFASGESKQFDIIWTAHWGGADHGAVRVGGYAATLAPDQPGHAAASSTVEAYNFFRFG